MSNNSKDLKPFRQWLLDRETYAFGTLIFASVLAGLNLFFSLTSILPWIACLFWATSAFWYASNEFFRGKKFGPSFLVFGGIMWSAVFLMGACYYAFGWFS